MLSVLESFLYEGLSREDAADLDRYLDWPQPAVDLRETWGTSPEAQAAQRGLMTG